MKTSLPKVSLGLLALVCALAFAGCSSVSSRPAAFISNGESLEKGSASCCRRLQVTEPVVPGPSVSLFIEPVELRLPDNELARLDTKTRQDLCAKADESLRAVWGKRLTLAADRDSATLRLRTAITQLDRSNPTVNVATTLLLFVPLDVGGIAVESELCDARSGRQLAALIHTRGGNPFHLKACFSQTGQAKHLFECISEDFAKAACPAADSTPRLACTND